MKVGFCLLRLWFQGPYLSTFIRASKVTLASTHWEFKSSAPLFLFSSTATCEGTSARGRIGMRRQIETRRAKPEKATNKMKEKSWKINAGLQPLF